MAGSTATPTTSTTSPATASSATGGGGASAAGGGATSAAAAAGGATALFPCLVYYPGSQNYSLIWVPMDGSNPIVSGANILGGSGAVGENDLSTFIAKREELGEEVRSAVDKKTDSLHAGGDL